MTETVIIVGKPNVGKSSLFNCLLKKKLALVDKLPRYTRDIKKKKISLFNNEIILVDSPGLFRPKDKFENEVINITKSQILESDIIILVFDAKHELTVEDYEIVSYVRKLKKKKIVILNKTEGKSNSETIDSVKKFGIGNIIFTSAAHMEAINLVEEEIYNNCKFENENPQLKPDEKEHFSLAIVGKTNSGKSTLINTLKGENIAITGNLPHLTRDAVETDLKTKNQYYRVIDTAGFSKDFSGIKNFNKVFIDQTKKKIRLSQIILILMDIDDYFERLHSKIIRLVYEENRCMLLAVNKIDKYKNIPENLIKTKLYNLNPQITGLPIVFISAKKRIGINSLIDTIREQNFIWKKRIGTGKLNTWLEKLTKQNPPALHKGRSIRFKYITQANCSPPKFNIFVNYSDALKLDYKRFIENNLRKTFNLNGLPLKIIYKKTVNPYD